MKQLSLTMSLCCIAIAMLTAQHPVNRSFLNASQGRESGTFLYTLTTSTDTYTDLTNPISINNGELWDEPEYFYSIGFPFEMLEEAVSVFEFYGGGSLARAETSEPGIYTYLFPFETDLIDRGSFGSVSLSPISYKVEGPTGSRIFKLEFKNAGSYIEMEENNTLDMFINFQMWLYEGSNTIQFRFGPNSIDDPLLFYGEDVPGPLVGLVHYDEENDIISDAHFLTGDPSSPALSTNLNNPFIEGTPANGSVYTLSLDLPLAIDLFVTPITSYCEPNGVIEAEVSGGVAPYTYTWSNGDNTPIVSDLSEGSYTVTVSDQAGNSGTASIIVTSLVVPMTLEITATDETAAGANDGTALVVPSEGAAPYTYEWSNGETTAFIEDLAPGTYTVTVTDAEGCTEEAEAIINPFGCPELLLEAGVQNALCFESCDGSITIIDVVNGTAPFMYEWDNGDNGATTGDLCAGIYSVTVTDNNQCVVAAAYEITEPTALVANAISTNETLAGENDGTATAASFGGTPPYGFLWSNGETTQMLSNLAPGTYSVIVTDLNNCQAFDTVVVEAGPCAILTGDVTDATCFGVCDGSIELGPGFASYIWSPAYGPSFPDSLCAGDYTVTATDVDGCVVEATFTVNQPNELIATTGSTAETIAGGDGTAWVVPTGGTPPYAYAWSNGSTDSLITGLLADLYFVTLTDAQGCSTVDSVYVDEFVCFQIIIDEAEGPSCFGECDGIIFLFVLGEVGPLEFAWSNGDTSDFAVDLCSGFHSVTVTDLGQGGCQDIIFIELTEPDSFYITSTVVHETDSTQGSIAITVYGGTPPYANIWTGPNGFLNSNEDLDDIEPGVYVLSLFDGNNCTIIESFEVLDLTVGLPVIPESEVSIYPNPATTQIQIDTKLQGDYTVELFSSIGKTAGTWLNATQIDVNELVPGLYVVMFKNNSGYFVKRIVVQ